MADSTLSSSTATIVTVLKADVAVAKVDVAVAKTKVEAVIAFVKAHWSKGAAAVVGYLISNFSVISTLFHKVF